MRLRSILFFLLIVVVQPQYAQTSLVTCGSERKQNNTISIFADSRAYGTCTVKVSFTSLSGYTVSKSAAMQNVVLSTVERGKQEMFTLTQNPGAFSSLMYQYRYYPGQSLRKPPDTAFVYLLPGTVSNQLGVSKVSSLEERLGQKRTAEFYSTGFVYKKNDTVCAARAGIVYECADTVKNGEKTNDFYKDGRNKISIQHRDGTLCTYEMLAPIQLLVRPGDYILPGTPLAVFNKESDKYMVLMSSYYLDEKKLLIDADKDTASPYVFIPEHFYAGSGSSTPFLQENNRYTVQYPKDILGAEMSKKEKKKLGLY